jgi:hypothetical protein
MRLFSWLRQQIGTNDLARSARQRRSKEGRVPRVRPRLEFLEDRCVPSTLTVDHSWDNSAPPNVPAPQGTLEWAAASAQNGDTIIITGAAVNHGINLTHGEVILTQQNLTIMTAPGKPPATISGDNLSRIFEVATGASVTLSNVTITGGNSVANNPASNASDATGGGIAVDLGATLTVIGSTLSSNSAIDQLPFGVTAGGGGAIINFGTLTIAGSTISANTVGSIGKGCGIENQGTLTVSQSTVSGNFGGGAGGGICNTAGSLTVKNTTISGNSSYFGGGIDNLVDATATVTGCMLSGNSASFQGGGILNVGTLSVSGSNLAANSAGYYGGGIGNTGVLIVTGCTVSGNSAGVFGGGIWNSRYVNLPGVGTLTMSNTTLSGNSAGYYGGGIFNDSICTVTLNGCALSGNSARSEGGGIYNAGILYVLSASTVTGDTAPAGADLYNLGTFFISSDSIVGIIGP